MATTENKRFRITLRLAILLFTIAIVVAAVYGRANQKIKVRKQLVETGFKIAFDTDNVYRGFVNPGFPGAPFVAKERPEGKLLDEPKSSKWLNYLGLDVFSDSIRYANGERYGMDKAKFPGLVDSDLKGIAMLGNLVELKLGQNSITDEGLKAIRGLTKLEKLDLSGNEITDAGLVHLKGLNQLKSLDLGGNEITDEGFRLLSHLEHLEDLGLGGTKITGECLKDLACASNLVRLELYHNELLDSDHLVAIESMKNLEQIKINSSPINDELGATLAKLQHLRHLDLSSAPIGDEFMKHVKGKQIDWLGINGTKVTDASEEIILGMKVWQYYTDYDSGLSFEASLRISEAIDANEKEREEAMNAQYEESE